jgi:hypothetical protein
MGWIRHNQGFERRKNVYTPLKIGHRNNSRKKRDEATANHCVQSTTKSLGERRELSNVMHCL